MAQGKDDKKKGATGKEAAKPKGGKAGAASAAAAAAAAADEDLVVPEGCIVQLQQEMIPQLVVQVGFRDIELTALGPLHKPFLIRVPPNPLIAVLFILLPRS